MRDGSPSSSKPYQEFRIRNAGAVPFNPFGPFLSPSRSRIHSRRIEASALEEIQCLVRLSHAHEKP